MIKSISELFDYCNKWVTGGDCRSYAIQAFSYGKWTLHAFDSKNDFGEFFAANLCASDDFFIPIDEEQFDFAARGKAKKLAMFRQLKAELGLVE